MLTRTGGQFVKIAWARDWECHLTRGAPSRPPARFNRPGQDALYLSPDAESAHVAIGQTVAPLDAPRVLVTYQVESCLLVDLRLPEAAELYDLARRPWRRALEAGDDPPSWQAADRIRRDGHAGLIDPSRRRPGLWHITLFRWNEPGAPGVGLRGTPTAFAVTPDFR